MSHENSTREITDYLNDINDSIADISNFIGDMTFEEFESDKKTQYTVVHCLEVIGEAVKKIPVDVRNQYPHIPWKEIAGMRDKLIHEYFGVDLETVWTTIIDDIKPLKVRIVQIIEEIQ
jgi:uncharacterized protein with HEPN domain